MKNVGHICSTHTLIFKKNLSDIRLLYGEKSGRRNFDKEMWAFKVSKLLNFVKNKKLFSGKIAESYHCNRN